jgi:hypothetical protein
VVDALSHIFELTKESGVPDQTTNISLSFYNQCGYEIFSNTSLLETLQFNMVRSKEKTSFESFTFFVFKENYTIKVKTKN